MTNPEAINQCGALARPRYSYPEHVPTEPVKENGWASWWCVSCGLHCASDNPCDHCELDGDYGL